MIPSVLFATPSTNRRPFRALAPDALEHVRVLTTSDDTGPFGLEVVALGVGRAGGVNFVRLHAPVLTPDSGAFVARRLDDLTQASVSYALDRLVRGYAAVVEIGSGEATYTLDEARMLYEALYGELFDHEPSPTRFAHLATDLLDALREQNWDAGSGESAPEAEWPTWQHDLIAKVRRLTPAGVLFVRDAVDRVVQLRRRGAKVETALVEVGLAQAEDPALAGGTVR